MPVLVTAQPGGKVNHYGIEVVRGITWKGWEPGKEYTKNIVLKNVCVKTQKLKYKVPQTRFFHTLYPQPIILSAGTNFTLPVTFRPLEKNIYEDKIEFTTNGGKFAVPIHAVLPEFGIEAPENIQFNMCAVADTVQLSFDIRNISELVTPFHVDCMEPFTIEPQDGVLEPFGSYTLHTIFKPKAAAVYEGQAVIRYGSDYSHNKITKLEGVGKFAHLLVACNGQVAARTPGGLESVVNFGEVSINQTAEKWIQLRNVTPVNAPFHIDHPSSQHLVDTVFQCPQKHGVVPANGTIRIPIIFKPNSVGSKSIDYFNVVPAGNISKTIIRCMASSKGPVLRLSQSSVNFLQVRSGFRATKTIEMINDSDTDAMYQFMLDVEESVFKLDEPSGVLPAHSQHTLVIHFQPVHPINYYRRLTCLIHNQGALYLDVLGTCHTETAKPAVLQTVHLERYQKLVQRGLSFTAPEQLNEMVKDGKLKLDAKGFLIVDQDDEKDVAATDPMDEYFNDGYYSEVTMREPHVSMDIHQADFGQCSDLRCIEQQVVNITNHTKGKITVVWMGDSSHVFSVSPISMDIPPLKSAPFTLTFRPSAPNQFFGSELECFAYYKSMRDYRLVEEATYCPPWCLALTATGHTFLPNNETFLPRFNLDRSRLVFPAVNAGEATYQTLILQNLGSTPILYDFEGDPHRVFSVKPTKGLLTANHQIFVIKVLPRDVKSYKHTLKLKLNDAEKNTQEILAWGSAESASVVLDNEGEMYFKPTCVGTASRRHFAVKNVSRIPLKFEWRLKNSDSKVLSVSPNIGIIHPNEKQHHEWTFGPLEQDKFVMKPELIVWGQGQSIASSGGKKRQFLVRAIGDGCLGSIKAEQSYLDIGTVVVGSMMTRDVTLINNADCNLHYRLIIDQTLSGPYPEEVTRDDPIALTLERMEGILHARSRQTVTVKVRPLRRVGYKFSISYRLLTPRGDTSAEGVDESHHLCHILTTGVYPTMAITDARCYGSLMGMSKKQLWNLLSLDELNVCLDSDPSAGELMYSMATRHSHRRRPPVHTQAIIDFNFGAAPVGSEPCVLQLMFENTGTIATEWSFLMPRDLQLELEYWAETGQFDDDELHEMKVMDNKLFVIEPKKGRLEPGETQTVTFTYKHAMAGTDRLPVLLKLVQGREILLNFIGVTVELDRHYIHFPSNRHMFAPVSIGEMTSPTQVYELYNGGAVPIKYEFDCLPLEIVKKENYDYQVFECLNPCGHVAPGQTMGIEWKFSPLEAKTYRVDVPIRIHNGDTALVTFTGVGYDKRVMGDTMLSPKQTHMSGVPSVQSVAIPGQVCFLSTERVSFGNIPLFTTNRRLVFMTNRSSQDPLTFEWHVTSKMDSKVASVWPSRGTLKPGQSKMCKVVFTALGLPAFYDLDLVCEVINTTEYATYRRDLRHWQEERQRQAVEFTITEGDLDDDVRTAQHEDRPPSGKLNPLGGTRTPTLDADLGRYKTLPPIGQRTVDEERYETDQQEEMETEFWMKPQPPKPFLLHLGITARTYDVTDYQLFFPEQYKNFFIDRTLIEKPENHKTDEEQKPVSCSEEEADIVRSVLTNIIRDLLDDTDFHEAIEKLSEEPVPYFQQFNTRRPPSPPVTPPTPAILVDSPTGPRPTSAGGPAGSPAPGHTGPYPTSAGSEPTDGATQPTPPTHTLQGVTGGHVTTARKPGQEEDIQRPLQEECDFMERQELKKNPEFASLLECLLENTLSNIIEEAACGEFDITARPRLVALPARPRSGGADKNNNSNEAAVAKLHVQNVTACG